MKSREGDMLMGIGGISPISGYSGIGSVYPMYPAGAVSGVRGASAVRRGSDGMAPAAMDGANDAAKSKRVEKGECQTCKNRK